MAFSVWLTDAATQDLTDLSDFIARYDSPSKADLVINQVEAAIKGLETSPERGNYPKELLALGIREFREIFVKPYRILYRVVGTSVYVLLIADGRQDMQTLLQRRLLQA